MAITLSTTHPITCSASAQRKPDPAHKTNNKWWAPLFGFSSVPDYNSSSSSLRVDSGHEMARPDFRGCFTEEKARELRKKTAESSNFHDIMYHSSIASRLASDVSRGQYGR